MAATNSPQTIDPALLRPGRFDRLVYVPMPDEAARQAIIQKKADAYEFVDIDAAELARIADGLSGAEIVNACDGAFIPYEIRGLEQTVSDMEVVSNALRKERRRVSPEMIKFLEGWKDSVRGI